MANNIEKFELTLEHGEIVPEDFMGFIQHKYRVIVTDGNKCPFCKTMGLKYSHEGCDTCMNCDKNIFDAEGCD